MPRAFLDTDAWLRTKYTINTANALRERKRPEIRYEAAKGEGPIGKHVAWNMEFTALFCKFSPSQT